MTKMFASYRKQGDELPVGEKWQARRAEVLAATAAVLLMHDPRESELAALARQAHRLAGCAGLFGEDRLGELARALEDSLRLDVGDDRRWREDARTLLAQAGFGRIPGPPASPLARTDPGLG